jgi:hypothetical protein
MSMTTKIAAVGLSAALGAGVFAAVPVLAQEDESPAVESSEWRDHMRERRSARVQALAAELGVDVETLRAAARSARATVQEQFDPPEDWNAEEIDARRVAFRTALAEELGVGEDQLRAAVRQVLSDSLAEAVAEDRVSQEEADQILGAFDDGTLDDQIRERRLARGIEPGSRLDRLRDRFGN